MSPPRLRGAGVAQPGFPVNPCGSSSGIAPSGATGISRVLANKLGENLRQQVIVDNRPGAATSSAGSSREIPLTATRGDPRRLGDQRLDVFEAAVRSVRDFTPIASIGLVPNALVVHPSLPREREAVHRPRARAAQADELRHLGHRRAEPHVSGAAEDARARGTHVPYKGRRSRSRRCWAGRSSSRFQPSWLRWALFAPANSSLGVTTVQRATAAGGADDPGSRYARLRGYWLVRCHRARGLPVAPRGSTRRSTRSSPRRRRAVARDAGRGRTPRRRRFGATMANDVKKWQKVVKAAGIKPQ